jgi:di/tricarboxylate transporter
VVAGLASTYYCRTMGIFELSTVGLPVCIAGIGCLLLLGPKVLPDAKEYERRTSYTITPDTSKQRKGKRSLFYRIKYGCCGRCFKEPSTAPEQGSEEEIQVIHGNGALPKASDFVFLATIPEGSVMHEKSVDEVGLRHLDGLFLTSVQRTNTLYSAVGPEFNLRTGDVLSFAGLASNFVPMCKAKGLRPIVEGDLERDGESTNPLDSFTVEAVVRSESDLVGKTMRDVSFRTRYHASALAIYRAGAELHTAKLGQTPLKVGDILVLVVSDQFEWDADETKRDLKPRFDSARQRFNSTATSAEHFTSTRDYVFPMRVTASNKLQLVRPLHGLTVEQAGLRNIPGARLVAVTRNGNTDRCVGPELVLEANDVLWFAGDRDSVSTLRRVPGLEDDDQGQFKKLNKAPQTRRLIEVVVSLQSDLLFKTVRESRFRTRFNAAIVAVQRHGQRVISRIGDIELEPGDVLIIEAGPEFVKRFRSDPNFLLISEIESSSPPRMDRFYIAAVAAISMVVATAATGIDLLLFAIFACAIILVTGVTTRERAHKSIDWKIIITVAAAFGLSTAMTTTKVADIIGRAITNLAIATNTGEMGVLAVVMIFTEILCALITAKAGALLVRTDRTCRIGRHLQLTSCSYRCFQ